ncbi:uncharacterized protein BJ171DRAFT_427035 [Polychytrium aggregatum]|uniref:uncharacterized protein n=1 Tax=Polychytrium aggregatum TaxID=110093 RepID=UPI0022FE17DA|nr:uncharacterized protein BJ171DRAFT_427035 [Polychytrium aggregatum]KAI9201831.1 hypothetical protein BJ171DRAFT_427035 [Polychytrium aggregatum]
MTASSLPVVFSGMVYQDDLLENPFFNPPFGVCSTAFFAAYLLLDIAIGWFYYREKLDPITGWLHHALYLSICITAIQLGATGLFMLACFMELPTIFLSLGHIHAPWRNDLIFGSVFFLTRIVYHGYLIWHVKVHMPSNYYFYVLAILVLPMHLYWFYRFAMQQIRNWRRSRSLALEQSSGV